MHCNAKQSWPLLKSTNPKLAMSCGHVTYPTDSPNVNKQRQCNSLERSILDMTPSNKPLYEPLLTQFYIGMQRHKATVG